MQLKELEDLKEEALSRQTELVLDLQKAKAEVANTHKSYKEKILKLENELEAAKSENIDLFNRIEEEARNKEAIEKRLTMEHKDYANRMSRIQEDYHSVKNKKQQLEETVADYERQIQRQSHIPFAQENTEKQLLEIKVKKYEEEIPNLKKQLKLKETETKELKDAKIKLEREVKNLQDQLNNAAEASEFSDPANYVLMEQVRNLEARLKDSDRSFDKEKKKFTSQLQLLENENEILLKQKKEQAERYEEQIARLNVEIQLLKQQLDRSGYSPSKPRKTITSELIESSNEEGLKQNLQVLTFENKDQRNRIAKLEDDYKILEKKLVDAKLGWANSDIEKENLVHRYKEAQEKLKEYASEFTMMEVEFYKINERFGQCINYNNELEMQIQVLRQDIENLKNKKR
jgi:chromosome segregation ATPase